MRLAELQVEGYGVLYNLHLGREDLLNNIIVISGPNEAGKSTLLSFILAVLFGFKGGSGRSGEPLRGGRQGGRLVFLDDSGGEYRVERFLQGRKDRVSVTLPDGTAGDERLLKSKILRGVTYPVYRNVFAFGLEELHRLEVLGSSEIGVHVYGAGAGIKAGRLTGALDRLQAEMDGLFKPGGSRPEINRFLKELEGLEAAIRLLQKEPDSYGQLQREVQELKVRRKTLEDRRSETARRLARLTGVQRARESWACLQEARRRLEGLAGIDYFPESGLERLQALEVDIRKAVLDLAELESRAAGLAGQLTEVRVDSGLLERSSRIREMEGERRLQQERLRLLPELAGEARRAGAEYRKQLHKLGSGEEQLANLDTTLAARETADNFKLKFTRAEAGLQEAETALAVVLKNVEDKEEDLRRAEQELKDLIIPAPPTGRSLEDREKALDILEAGQGKLAAVRARLEHRRALQDELQRNAATVEKEIKAPPPRLLPCWFIYGLPLALAALAAAAFAAGTVQGVAVLLAGSAVIALVLLAGRRADQAAREQVSRLTGHLQELRLRLKEGAGEIERLTREEAALLEEMQAAAGAALGKLQFTGEELLAARRALEEEKRAYAHREALRRESARAGETLARERHKLAERREAAAKAAASLAETGREWRSWLEGRGLPSGLYPQGVHTYFDAAEEARRLREAWQKAAAREEEARRRCGCFLADLNALLKDLGREPAALEGACDRAARLADELERGVKKAGEKERLERELTELRERQLRRENQLSSLRKELAELLAEGGAADPVGFRQRAGQYEEGRMIAEEIRSCERDLNILAGSPAARLQLEKDLAEKDSQACDDEINELSRTQEELERDIRKAGERIGALESRLAGLEKGEELAQKLQARETVIADLKNRAGEWQARALCLHLLKLARERHERQRQPAVLKRASRYLGPMTGGRYTGVFAPVGRTDLLEVETPHGVRVAASNLSRGAAAQLYLSVRLALARQYEEVSLPVILDDTLVDFDPERLEGAARVLAEYGRDRQVIFFTCHDHVLEVLCQGLENVNLVRLHDGNLRSGT